MVAGPIEATAAGNILMQAMAFGEIKSLEEARQLIRRSFPVKVYEPPDKGPCDDVYGKFNDLVVN